MGECLERLKLFKEDVGGQAVVEYILMVSLAILAAGIIGTAFRRTILAFWGMVTHDVTAACPTGCPSDRNYNFR